jgi:DNA adenine methylase
MSFRFHPEAHAEFLKAIEYYEDVHPILGRISRWKCTRQFSVPRRQSKSVDDDRWRGQAFIGASLPIRCSLRGRKRWRIGPRGNAPAPEPGVLERARLNAEQGGALVGRNFGTPPRRTLPNRVSRFGIKKQCRRMVPPIKCQGIKTKLVSWIRAIVPAEFEGRWIEPFMGSGVVAFNIRPRKAILADSNPHLIRFYRAILRGEITSAIVGRFLRSEGEALLRTEGEHYYVVRDRFNRQGDPLDFLFLNRACFNGMIRFNKKGGFNVPFCRKPHRFAQAYITKICNQIDSVAASCSTGNYEFRCRDHSETIPEADSGDILYCDPPYIARHTDYFNGWDEDEERRLAELLSKTKAKFILSTWHGNAYRSNEFIDSLWSGYNILTREHFYHVGAKEDNRNPMLEALVTNFPAFYEEPFMAKKKPSRSKTKKTPQKRTRGADPSSPSLSSLMSRMGLGGGGKAPKGFRAISMTRAMMEFAAPVMNCLVLAHDAEVQTTWAKRCDKNEGDAHVH